MSRDLLGAMDKARDLLCTPLALEVLDDLAHGRSPYERPDKSKVITAAVRCLESLGAARATSQQVTAQSPTVEITPRGRALYDRLVEIEEWAERQEADGTVSTGSP
jgi:DNA-binding HxlR family transcriptional regulator